MKKLVVALLICVTVLSVAACGSKTDTNGADSKGTDTKAAEKSAGVETKATDHKRWNRTIERLANHEPVYGIVAADMDIMNARRLANSKLDFVIIDLEHGSADFRALHLFIDNMRSPNGGFPVTPVRIPANGREVKYNQWMVKQILDSGALGIMFEQINTAEEARDAVVAMRYPQPKGSPIAEPRGQRGYSPYRGVPTLGVSDADYVKKADLWPLNEEGELLLIIQVETKQSVDNLKEILKVPGIGAVAMGPADFHADMGYLGKGGVPEVEAQIERGMNIAKEMGIPVGRPVGAGNVKERLEKGDTFITVGVDFGSLGSEITDTLKAVGR